MARIFDKYKGLKESFIKEASDNQNSQYLYRNVFESCYDKEFELNKDVSEFTFEELGELWGSMNVKSESTILSRKAVLGVYCQYAIDNGYNKTKINFVDMYRPEDLKKYVNQNWKENKIVDRSTMYDIIDSCENAQDAIPFILIFEGAWGAELEELRLLRSRDIDDVNNRLKLRKTDELANGLVERTIDVSDKCIDVLLQAVNEVEYRNANGIPNPSAKHKSFELMKTEYVLKNTIRGNSVESDLVSAQTIRQRLDKIKNLFEYKYLNPNNIRLSGMVDFAKKHMKSTGKNADQLTIDDYELIWDRYGGNPHAKNYTKKYSLKSRMYDYIKED